MHVSLASGEKMSERIRGVLAPVVTPFKADLSPDSQRFIAHCKWLLSQNCGQLPISWKLYLLLNSMNHGHGRDQDNGCNHLVRVKAGMKEAPSDAYGSQRLHHLEVARG